MSSPLSELFLSPLIFESYTAFANGVSRLCEELGISLPLQSEHFERIYWGAYREIIQRAHQHFIDSGRKEMIAAMREFRVAIVYCLYAVDNGQTYLELFHNAGREIAYAPFPLDKIGSKLPDYPLQWVESWCALWTDRK